MLNRTECYISITAVIIVEHRHCNAMATMSTILIFNSFFCESIANFAHVMIIFLGIVKGSHSLFGRYLRKEDS